MAKLLDISKLTYKEFQSLAEMNDEDRNHTIDQLGKEKYTAEEVQKIAPMTIFEEFFAILLFLFGVPGSIFSIPIALVILGFVTQSYHLVFTIGTSIGIFLAVIPAPFIEKSLSSWAALQIIRYFSFKGIFEERLKKGKPYIMVAPPHGVFPFGNIATMIAFPSFAGYSMRALAASAALKAPIFRQLLCTIGVVDASRQTAQKVLDSNLTLGISTGGVAEIFETDLSPDGDEVIVLKDRIGLIKLAFRTGSALVPCYLLGNTHLLSLYCGGKQTDSVHKFLKWISRKVGFAFILFWGRFFLPIPYRTTIVGVMSKPIEVPKKENPTEEELNYYHQLLQDEMIKLFNKHKDVYGWGNKQLIIR